MANTTTITVETIVNVAIEKTWTFWTLPEHITQWNNASDDWHTPNATNNLQVGGRFNYTMAAKDGSFSFDFWGIYNDIVVDKLLKITLGDSRKMEVQFFNENGSTKIIETFEAETENPIALQQQGWQAILNNFKLYVEAN